jgi:hypothetical protein
MFSAEDSIKTLGPFNIIIDTCTQSTISGKTNNTGSDTGESVTMNVTTLTFSNCIHPITVGTGGTLTFTHTSGTDNSVISSSGMTWTVHEVPNIIGNPSTCAYTTSNTSLGSLTGSTVGPTIDLSGTINSETKGCPSDTLSGHYIYTGSTPFTVSD